MELIRAEAFEMAYNIKPVSKVVNMISASDRVEVFHKLMNSMILERLAVLKTCGEVTSLQIEDLIHKTEVIMMYMEDSFLIDGGFILP